MSLINQTVMPIGEVPDWVASHAGFKPNRSTVHRWKTRGCRGKRLKTFRVGGRVCTSVEALLEFFDDEDNVLSGGVSRGADAAEAFLIEEGI